MASQISSKVFDFLKLIDKNNNREWFNDNKNLFLEAQSDFQDFTEELISEMGKFDETILKLDAKKSLLRIYRDTRFSKDKTPYKNYFGASLGMGKINTKAGFYLHVQPGKSFLGSGIYLPDSPVLKEIRKEISLFKDDFLKAIDDKDFKKHYGELDQEHKLKNVPQGFEKEDPMGEYLKLKSFIGVHNMTNKDLMEKNTVKNISKIFEAAKPLNDFLDTSISNLKN
ncbi:MULTISPECIES: DUF2461 domain-containing protein [Chryseobacterium]|uniref:DUF2461 domain-containing protein n=1 Tax=Chryseobacterium TaxID=59732 RepID=UPI0019592E8B|nr:MULTISPECIES: DUF2461 domain-containing protein [Chryseobacterium]MBM7421096.1 uncharacterized protein (TIGR02453 family) [Chryseobacterium sp. JUb44]MDH6211054.1 uncharacterized protein (TIGR02453 family) [Chryseobacterium sp. BIGb0186]WSO09719.1 DUF2461 domain-containing protein [Chryseobacterium scophthalmum]